MTSPTAAVSLEPPKKKRKYIKKAIVDEDDVQVSDTSIPGVDTLNRRSDDSDGDLGPSVADILRLRKLASSGRQRSGIQHNKSTLSSVPPRKSAATDSPETPPSYAPPTASLAALLSGQGGGVERTFTQQTNEIDVDKHMLEFIEEEMARKKAGMATTANDESNTSKKNLNARDSGMPDGVNLGTLAEVDLGNESKLANIAATEQARRPRPLSPNPSPRTKDGTSRTEEDLERDRLIAEELKAREQIDTRGAAKDVKEVYSRFDLSYKSREDVKSDEKMYEEFKEAYLEQERARRKGR